MKNDATIAAISTASGRGGIGVIRISGKRSLAIANTLCGVLPKPRLAQCVGFKNKNSDLIDSGLILYFPAPNSYTGESVIELHGHGGAVVLDQMLARVLELGARLARPGEFSERAFLNDKLDLAQAEAVADLIDASSQKAARAAVRSLEGEFSRKIKTLLSQLIQLRIHVESAIDFPEEEIDFLKEGQIEEKTLTLLDKVVDLLNNASQGRLLRDGITIVIAGKPNAGKSSLLNALAGSESAIVTEIPGTTRDVLKEAISIDGLPVNIVDTAGLRESDDPVEREGVRRAREQIKKADCILYVCDLTQAGTPDLSEIQTQDTKTQVIQVFNKIDKTNLKPDVKTKNQQTQIYISAKTGDGINLLKEQLKMVVGYQSDTEGLFIARRRHLDALQRAKNNITNGLKILQTTGAGELLAEDLLYAQNSLNEITGEFGSDDLLGEIFSSFCIGK